MLTELQVDALKEYMNQFIGQAANLLSEMVNKKVDLQVPNIALIEYDEQTALKQIVPEFLHSYIVSSSISFGDDFNGEAKLIFPVKDIKQLVYLCLDEEQQDFSNELNETDLDAIKEIGNIILNAVVGAIGNLVEVRLEYNMPRVDLLNLPNDMGKFFGTNKIYLLIIRNSFSVNNDNIEGAIIVLLSLKSINGIVEKVDQIINSYDF